MIRRPAVAGAFYSADPARLKSAVDGFLRKGPPHEALGVIVPHAGYLYSGGVAGSVYGLIKPPESALVLGPNHTGLGPDVSIMCRGSWQTPFGTMRIEEGLASSLLAGSELLVEDDSAHRNEHCIEVQLPFLQTLGVDSFVPIVLMGARYDECEALGTALAEAIRQSERSVLMVASSDMTHYESRETAEVKDRLALEQVERLDPEGLYDVVRKRRITMCGFIPATVMLVAARKLGATKAEVVRYATSGDVTGDYEQVVGYAGVIVS
jgi:AmmeMemoRadiSam system protein B